MGFSTNDLTGTSISGFLRDARGRFTTINRPGATLTLVFDSNNRGQLVGVAGTPTRRRARHLPAHHRWAAWPDRPATHQEETTVASTACVSLGRRLRLVVAGLNARFSRW